MKTSFLPQTTMHEAARSSSRIRFAFRRSRAFRRARPRALAWWRPCVTHSKSRWTARGRSD